MLVAEGFSLGVVSEFDFFVLRFVVFVRVKVEKVFPILFIGSCVDLLI